MLILKFLFGKCPGTSCRIPYGHGHIPGFFSQDNLRVGELIVKDQVFMTLISIFIQMGFCGVGFSDGWLFSIQQFAEITKEGPLAFLAHHFDGILGLGFLNKSVGQVTPVW